MDDDYGSDFDEEANSMLEPQVILGSDNEDGDGGHYEEGSNDSSMLEVQIDDRFAAHSADEGESNSFFESMDDSQMDNGPNCYVCQESLSIHFAGQPCGTFDGDESSMTDADNSCYGGDSGSGIKVCPVCQGRNPSREHLANHFIQELAECIEGETECSKCDFRVANTSKSTVKNQTKILALHHVTDHGGAELDELLNDEPLVESKREDFESRRPSFSAASPSSGGQRIPLPPECPICDQTLHKQHARDHVSWHFMDELRQLIADPSQCPECSYTGDKLEAVSRHLALFHNKLDEFLLNDDLVASKRIKAMSKPKKVTIGPHCLICGLKDPAREHVSRHFMKELMEIVSCFPDPTSCPECNYRGEKAQSLARHIALVHSKLDELLADDELVESRRQEHLLKPNKVIIGDVCPVCDTKLTKQHSRVHVIWHFIDELRSIVNSFVDNTACDYCDYTNNNSDKVVKHIALGHSKLDEMLSDVELLQRKRTQARSKPKKQSIGPKCPVCELRDPPRDHVARHFADELMDYVMTLPDQQQCSQCPYRSERAKNLSLHIALVHGRLDFLLKDAKLVHSKRNKFLSQPKKQTIGPHCPICDIAFTKSQNRDHVTWHFVEELREFVQSFENPQKCWKCEYTSDKLDNLVKHVALGHSKLDELLANKRLVAQKRAKVMARPKKVAIASCPVCEIKEPAREHVARHFSDELLAIVADYPDPTQCVECEYKGDKPKTLSIHVALVHARLDMFLQDADLIEAKHAEFLSKPKKLNIGPNCPVCNIKFTKTQNRDHVAWHYMDELRSIVQEFDDPTQCPQCPYKGDTNEKMVKHIALGHSMLDTLLQNEELLEQKRAKAMSKPRKVTLGQTCPVCDMKEPSREHVARHFGDELVNIVMEFEDPSRCSECNYRSDKPKNVAIHIALVHAILDHFLANDELVQEKREMVINKPQRINVGSKCPVCDAAFSKGTNRDHICWHFMDELRDYVLGFPDTTACNECTYASDKLDNLTKHVALAHHRLDVLLADEDLVAQKRSIAINRPKKINIGPTCPVCDITFTKSQNRDHVAWHFMDEFREFVQQTGSELNCQMCHYATDKSENLLKHYALGHSKLDEYLQNEELVAKKREIHQQKPKRLSLGPDCIVCGAKGRDRDHMARHYLEELTELVQALPSRRSCNLCEYKHPKTENMAKHLGLFHCKLDELLLDEELLKHKRAKYANKPQRVSIGDCCVICSSRMHSREHVCRHFLPELLAIVNNFHSPLSCGECEFTATKSEYVARHLGLVHCKLDEFLQDQDMVTKKKEEFLSTASVRVTPVTPAEGLRKSSRQKVAPSFFKEEIDASPVKRKSTDSTPVKPAKIMKLDSDVIMNGQSSPPGGNRVKPEPEVITSLETKPVIKPNDVKKPSGSTNSASLLRTSLLKPDVAALNAKIAASAAASTQLPASITLSPALPRAAPPQTVIKKAIVSPAMPTKPDPKLIEEVNNSWAQSLMSKSKRPKVSSPNIHETLASLSPAPLASLNTSSVTLQRVNPLAPKKTPAPVTFATASIVAINGSKTSIPLTKPPSLKITPHYQRTPTKSGGDSDAMDDDYDTDGMLFEPQVILNTSTHEDVDMSCGNEDMEADTEEAVEEFCDVCSMELINHADEQPCDTTDDYVKIYRICRVCDFREPTREHVSRHFLPELLEVVECFPNPLACTQCDYQGDTTTMVALHVALVHQQIDEYLDDLELVRLRRRKISIKNGSNTGGSSGGAGSSNGKFELGDECPVCSNTLSRQYKRDHVIWHFMDDLKQMVMATVPHDGIAYKCLDCEYFVDKLESMARHLGLFHNKLDVLLRDSSLVEEKRQKTIATRTTKREPINLCPLCDFKEPSREHISRHFMNELLDHVATLPDNLACNRCNYRGERPQNLAKHIALVHSKLDEFLRDPDLVQMRREEIMAKPKKISIGSVCPVCKQDITKRDSRVHVIWHFMEDLRAMVQSFPDPQHCQYCPYTNPNIDKMAKHMALGHSKLDELLSNEDIVREKQEKALSKPKKLSIGPCCPICGVQFSKHQNRDHVSWHFMEELREYVLTFENPKVCNQCPYTSDKLDNLVKHVALGHSKLDELLLNEELVEMKRAQARAKPKKLNLGPNCPICGVQFTRAQSREHVCWHFMDELREIVNALPDPTSCTQCEYTSDKIDNLVKHIGLGHSKIDEFLLDDDLVAKKRQRLGVRVPRLSNPSHCPVCYMANPLRDHLVRHFLEELLEIVDSEQYDQLFCDQCEFRGETSEKLARHLGLAHGKLDEFLSNTALVAEKCATYNTTRPIAEITNQQNVQCIVCDAFMTRQQLRRHCAQHFIEEMQAIAAQFSKPSECDFCTESGATYQTENASTMGLHIALAHSKLEELLADDAIVKMKRSMMKDNKSALKNGPGRLQSDDIIESEEIGDDEESLVEEDDDNSPADDLELDEMPVTAEIDEDEYEDIIYEEDEENKSGEGEEDDE